MRAPLSRMCQRLERTDASLQVGQGLVEYAVITTLVGVTAILVLAALGQQVSSLFAYISSVL